MTTWKPVVEEHDEVSRTWHRGDLARVRAVKYGTARPATSVVVFKRLVSVEVFRDDLSADTADELAGMLQRAAAWLREGGAT